MLDFMFYLSLLYLGSSNIFFFSCMFYFAVGLPCVYIWITDIFCSFDVVVLMFEKDHVRKCHGIHSYGYEMAKVKRD